MPIELKQRRLPKKRRPHKGKGTKYRIRCIQCGKEDKVPFKPRKGKLLCSFCYRQKKEITPDSA